MFTYEVEAMKEYPLQDLKEGFHVIYQKIKKCAAQYIEETQSIREIECEIYEEVCLFKESGPHNSLVKVACYLLGEHVNDVEEAATRIRKEHAQYFT